MCVCVDEISCAYIDKFLLLLELLKIKDEILIKADFAYTPRDLASLKRLEKFNELNPNFPYAGLGGSVRYIFANLYGLCDLPQKVFSYINGKDVIDGGGYIGDTALLFSHMFKDSKIYALEPMAKNYEALQHVVTQSGKSGTIMPLQEGIAEHSGELDLMVYGDNLDASASFAAGNASLLKTSRQKCKVASIDDLCKRENLNPGLIKLDIEGLEFEAIRGALATLKEHRPVLAVAIYHNPEEFFLLKPYLESLNLGYKFMIRRSECVLPMADLLLIAYPEECS